VYNYSFKNKNISQVKSSSEIHRRLKYHVQYSVVTKPTNTHITNVTNNPIVSTADESNFSFITVVTITQKRAWKWSSIFCLIVWIRQWICVESTDV